MISIHQTKVELVGLPNWSNKLGKKKQLETNYVYNDGQLKGHGKKQELDKANWLHNVIFKKADVMSRDK